MSEMTQVLVSLPRELEQLAREAVATGEYATIDDVVAAALLAWGVRDGTGPDDATLVRLWNEGLASGPSKSGTMDDIKREGRRRLADASQESN